LPEDVGTSAQVLITFDLTTRVSEIQLTERGTAQPLRRQWWGRWMRVRVVGRGDHYDDDHYSDGNQQEKDEIRGDDCDSRILPLYRRERIGTGFVRSNAQ
jgi:hypothetical protein